MVKVNDITHSISEVSNKGIIILVPRKEKRIRFKKGKKIRNWEKKCFWQKGR